MYSPCLRLPCAHLPAGLALTVLLSMSVPLSISASSVFAQSAGAGYQLPPAALQAVVDAPRAPTVNLSPQRNLAALVKSPALPGIADVAQPELKLAGVRINPRSYSASRFSFGQDLWLMDIGSQQELPIKSLPGNLKLADLQWSPDQRYVAFTHLAGGADDSLEVQLWLVDVASRAARQLSTTPLNTVYGRGFSWMPDSQSLLVRLRPVPLLPPPPAVLIPSGPNMQETAASKDQKQIRTYQDLLKNPQDAKLFDHYTLTQLARVNVNGSTSLVGTPARFNLATPSPDGKLILTRRIEAPYSYVVPASSFPHRIEVRNLGGEVVHSVANIALEEGLPAGNDAVEIGVRSIGWRSDAPATLVWSEAQDGGDPARKVEVRDIVYTHAAPFSEPPRELIRLATRYAGVEWGRGDLALVHEYWWKTRAVKTWRVMPDPANERPATAPQLLFSYASEDRYSAPGEVQMRFDAAGNRRILTSQDGASIYLVSEGASPEGNRPFVDRFNLSTQQKQRLFRSAAPVYERIVALLDGDGRRLLSSRESPTEPPNYFLRDLGKAEGAQLTALTRFPHPLPQLRDIQKEQIRYQRADGVDLTATLYLPAGYQPQRDGPLPMLMWAYPREFASASAASQVTESPFRFNAVGYWGPQAMLAMGYAVLDGPTMPIVGEGGKEANDTYLPQLIASAQAAVDEVVRRGVTDRDRIAIGGHSYGAFMTANLLAHTRLFRAGIARSGAYNRTLTPFGFQAEERNYWQAMAVYQAMSPFNYADRIRDPILMIHGEQDDNSGTFPIQSERLFQALKGLGATARLVTLPNEAHAYRSRESIMHMLYETNLWMEKYVKNAPVRQSAAH
jgi:dipeptidyl aminopeptidase/acylaminoacyl peptidase